MNTPDDLRAERLEDFAPSEPVRCAECNEPMTLGGDAHWCDAETYLCELCRENPGLHYAPCQYPPDAAACEAERVAEGDR